MTDEPGGIPVRCRVGDGPERIIGHLNTVPDELPSLLRDAADEIERLTKDTPSTENL